MPGVMGVGIIGNGFCIEWVVNHAQNPSRPGLCPPPMEEGGAAPHSAPTQTSVSVSDTYRREVDIPFRSDSNPDLREKIARELELISARAEVPAVPRGAAAR